MTDKKNIKGAKNIGETVIKKQNTINEKEVERRVMAAAEAVKKNTITEKEIKDHKEDDWNDFNFGNTYEEKTEADDDKEFVLNAMTYGVATYGEAIGGNSGIFTRFMALTRERDHCGKKKIDAMIYFLCDIIKELTNEDFIFNETFPTEEKRLELLEMFTAAIFILSQHRDWK
ncbi:hypothetical protein [Pseudomonas sp. PS01297]|uniref:hypothetical protein n=1 Tax=Pseudomonas sp. PS01297 TaxID=2991433 RepID=UPI00249B62BB|nr:hypothetical protein [Pseudomonas sp. PS01297]